MKSFWILFSAMVILGAVYSHMTRSVPAPGISNMRDAVSDGQWLSSARETTKGPAPEAPLPANAYVEEAAGAAEKAPLRPIVQAAKRLVYVVTDSRASYEEFRDSWTPLLVKAGLGSVEAEYSAGMGMLRYSADSGAAVRVFICDTAYMPRPVEELERRIAGLVEANGMKVLGISEVPSYADMFPHKTRAVYYLTVHNENPDHEVQLRYFSASTAAVKVDYDLLESAGLKIVDRYNSRSAFYVGRRLGLDYALAGSLEMAERQVAYYKELVSVRKEELIGVRIEQLPDPAVEDGQAYNYLTKVYYFR